MTPWVKRAAATLFGEYELYHILRSPELDTLLSPGTHSPVLDISELHEPDECAASESGELRTLSTQFGAESIVLGVRDHGRLVGGAVVWYGDRYANQRGFWPLQADEAKLVNIVVEQKLRGRGIAASLIAAVEHAAMLRGFRRVYARVWHSHSSSVRAFQKAAWCKSAFVVVCRPFGLARPFRFQIARAIAGIQSPNDSHPINVRR